jgi:hypothetical protein
MMKSGSGNGKPFQVFAGQGTGCVHLLNSLSAES